MLVALYVIFYILILLSFVIYSDYKQNDYLIKIFNTLNRHKMKKCLKKKHLLCVDYVNIIQITNILFFSTNVYSISVKNDNISGYNFAHKEFVHISKRYFISNKKFIPLKFIATKNVILSREGTIHSDCWDLTTNGGCMCWNMPSTIKKEISVYDKVITISHHFCSAIYHSIIECLAKIGYFIPQLLNDRSIKIHMIKSVSVKYMLFLGFEESRFIYGDVYAKRLIIPEKGNCGYPPSIVHLNFLRLYLRKRILSTAMYDIILIKRLGKREIINFKDIFLLVKHIYHDKKVIIFYPNTSFTKTLNYFKYAKLIIAPHGAGLSNIIISSSMCKIIEFYYDNICYLSLALYLGLEYYGIKEKMINTKFMVNISYLRSIIKKVII